MRHIKVAVNLGSELLESGLITGARLDGNLLFFTLIDLQVPRLEVKTLTNKIVPNFDQNASNPRTGILEFWHEKEQNRIIFQNSLCKIFT